MADSKNKDFYYIMWLPDTAEIIWDMKNKTQMSSDFYLYHSLNQHIDLGKWTKTYTELYKDWLEADTQEIYNLQNPSIQKMLSAIQKVNTNLPQNTKLFYWFDVDRTENEDFIWENSPIDRTKLVDLGEGFYYLNRFVDLKNYVVFPAQEDFIILASNH